MTRALTLLLGAQLADLAAYLMVGRPDDSIVQALGVDVAPAKLAGIAVMALIVLRLRLGPDRSPAWAVRCARWAALAGMVGAASGLRVLLAP